MAIGGWTGVDVAVSHLRNKNVFHCNLEVRVGVHDGVESCGVARHIIILQCERTELMQRGGCSLKVVGKFARNNVTLKVATAIDNAGRHFEQTGWGGEEAALYTEGYQQLGKF